MKLNKDDLKAKSPEELVLLSLGNEIVNFHPDFNKKSLRHTFVLSQYGSAMFGLFPKNGLVYLGVPELFFNKFKNTKWNYAARVDGDPGLFLVMNLGEGKLKHDTGIRIFLRTKRLSALDEEVRQIRIIPMDENGFSREKDVLQGFNIRLQQCSRYNWEFEAKDAFAL